MTTKALSLPAGLKIDCPEKLLLRFLENEWEIYDGQPNAQDSTLSLFDILVSVSMNSRIDTADKVRSIWDGRHGVQKALTAIPVDARLTDQTPPWEELANLFEVFCHIPYAKEAVSTKILHRKRPSLIPIVDSVIGMYLNKVRGAEPVGKCLGDRLADQVRVFRSVLVECLPSVSELSSAASQAGYPITCVRTLEILIWASCEPNKYYRKSVEGETNA